MSPGFGASLHLRVITPGGLIVEAEVEEVTIPGPEGYLGILPGHRPLYTALGSGELTYQAAGRRDSFSVRGGYAEVGTDKVTIFTDLGGDEKVQP